MSVWPEQSRREGRTWSGRSRHRGAQPPRGVVVAVESMPSWTFTSPSRRCGERRSTPLLVLAGQDPRPRPRRPRQQNNPDPAVAAPVTSEDHPARFFISTPQESGSRFPSEVLFWFGSPRFATMGQRRPDFSGDRRCGGVDWQTGRREPTTLTSKSGKP
jgi:hypothetical protein